MPVDATSTCLNEAMREIGGETTGVGPLFIGVA